VVLNGFDQKFEQQVQKLIVDLGQGLLLT